MPHALRPKVEEELRRLQNGGIHTRSRVEWVENSHGTRPKERWISTNMRRLQSYSEPGTTSSAVPLPHIEDIFPSLAGGQKFSKIDLRQAYHQLEMEEDSKTISLSTLVWACSVQPSSVRHHICTRYLATYDWPSAGKNIWYKWYTWWYQDHYLKGWWRTPGKLKRSPATATTSWFKSKEGKICVLQEEDNLLWAWYRQQWSTQVSGAVLKAPRPNDEAEDRSLG